jgi:hypothetical protein
MSDRDFLLWLLERFVHVHGEPANVDYIIRLRAIAEARSAVRS